MGLEDEEEATRANTVPANFKKFQVGKRHVCIQTAERDKLTWLDQCYDGPKNTKHVNLADEGKKPKNVWIATDLTQRRKHSL